MRNPANINIGTASSENELMPVLELCTMATNGRKSVISRKKMQESIIENAIGTPDNRSISKKPNNMAALGPAPIIILHLLGFWRQNL
jgi:hypothetical protein